MRPLWYEFPEATDAYDVQSEFMFGDSMLVAPVLEAGAASVEAYLPTAARWFDAHTGQEVVRRMGWVSGQSPRHKVGSNQGNALGNRWTGNSAATLAESQAVWGGFAGEMGFTSQRGWV